jgi:hypothetical protein
MGNGGVNYGDDGILCYVRGSLDVSSSLYEMRSIPPYNVRAVVTSFYGQQLISVNDVVVHGKSSINFMMVLCTVDIEMESIPGGTLIGRILVSGGTADYCFGQLGDYSGNESVC